MTTYEFTSPARTTESAQFEIEASADTYVSHRFQSWRADGFIKDMSDVVCVVFKRDAKSPTGRLLAASLHDADEAEAILKRHGRI